MITRDRLRRSIRSYLSFSLGIRIIPRSLIALLYFALIRTILVTEHAMPD
jgi:hypothetical protein